MAAHAAAADLEAAQAALLRRLLGTYALKAYKGEGTAGMHMRIHRCRCRYIYRCRYTHTKGKGAGQRIMTVHMQSIRFDDEVAT